MPPDLPGTTDDINHISSWTEETSDSPLGARQDNVINGPELQLCASGNSTGQGVTQSTAAPVMLSTQSALTRTQPQVASFSGLYNAVMQSIPPAPSSALVLASSSAPTPTVAPALTSAPLFTSASAPITYSSGPLIQSAAPPPTNVPTAQPSHRNSRHSSVLQSEFFYDEVTIIHIMAKRWAWFLATQDCFPGNVLPAHRLCIAYAEEILGMVCQVSRRMCDHVSGHYHVWICTYTCSQVCNKDSRIRNDFQTGLLKIVEHDYGVDNGESSAAKIDELLTSANFIYTGYDAKVSTLNQYSSTP